LHRLLGGVGGAALLLLGGVGAAAAQSYEDGVAAALRHDDAAALQAFRAAADHGSVPAEYELGQVYEQGRGVPKDDAQAVDWFRKAADEGNPGAQFSLGQMYEIGEGLPRDQMAAAGCYLRAAAEGYSSAEVRIGELYAQGSGVPKDLAQALTWYAKAAAQMDSSAELDLGLMYLNAPRQPPRTDESGGDRAGMPQERFDTLMNGVFGARAWRETGGYRSPARENQLRAQGAETVPAGTLSRHSLGNAEAPGAFDIVVAGMSPEQAATRLRRSGIGFRRLFPETTHGTQGPHLHVEPLLMQAAIATSHAGSQPTTNHVLVDGINASAQTPLPAPWAQTPAQNQAAALSWFLRAAGHGSAAAAFNLGLMYRHGEGVQHDEATARGWLLKSAQEGDAAAQRELGGANVNLEMSSLGQAGSAHLADKW
jgi:TPR repeat protein